MKATLAFDNRANQFRCDVGRQANGKPKRFYLSADPEAAQSRKVALNKLWGRCKAQGHVEWTADALTAAEAIRKGTAVELRHEQDEREDQYAEREARMVKTVGGIAKIKPAIISADLTAATHSLMALRIAQLEKLVRDSLGNGVVVGESVTVHKALDEWHEYRRTTELSPDTGEATEHVRTQGNNVKLVKRLIPADVPLSRLNYIELQRWCKAVANRPLSLKTGRAIKRTTARNCLKVIRAFVKWASQLYGWRKPEDWHEATLAMSRRTKQERREAKYALTKYYIPEEIGTLWKFALPSERMLMLLGLNFGYAQQEIIDMDKQDLAAEEVAAIRGKTEVFGKWIVWPETRELAVTQFDRVPKRRQHIANRWNNLLDRVQRDQPDFKRLSFKWLRKSGSSLIRKATGDDKGGETASVYLSHGEAASTDDELLELYADVNWDRLCSALRNVRDQLLPHLQAEAVTSRTYVARSKIDQIREGWKSGLNAEGIQKSVGVSRATVYRYKPSPALVE